MKRPKICECCRKHVKHVVASKVLFAERVDMKRGMVPIYREKHSFRCDAHLNTEVPGERVTSVTIAKYDELLAKMEAAQ